MCARHHPSRGHDNEELVEVRVRWQGAQIVKRLALDEWHGRAKHGHSPNGSRGVGMWGRNVNLTTAQTRVWQAESPGTISSVSEPFRGVPTGT